MCASVVDGDHNNGGGEATVCSLADFVGWSDFPKGLRILLLDHDNASAAETKSKLEQMDYVVSLFSSEKEAVEAILGRIGSFHVAIVEVNATNNQESFRFLETARGLPTVMVSNGNCLSTMMKCIALGAVEILQKPLSEEKIKNIWQHAVHKAFNAGENALAKSLKPIRETVSTMFELQPDTWKNANGVPEDGTTGREGSEKEHANRLAGYGLPSPSTPQAEQGIRSLDAGDSRGPSSHSSAEHECEVTCKDTADFTFSCSESKFVDITRIGSNGDNPEEESMKTDPPKESAMSSDSKNEHFLESVSRNPVRKEPSPNHVLNHSGSKNGRKKTKVDWTAELHRRFVRAVEQLGIDQAIPSKILALMKVEGLTRHNIASHLQKYRMQRNNAFPKDGGRWWVHRRDSSSRAYAQKPVLAMPPPHSNFGSPQPVYPAWGHPQFHPSGSQLWGHAGFYPWHQGSWPWKSRTRMHADAWGCPVFSPQNDYSTMTTKICQNVPLTKITPDHNRGGGNIHEPQLTEDVIDEVVKEAISKPWLPLPIGLKPPSTDSVLAELHLQGIHSMPPNPCHRPRSQA